MKEVRSIKEIDGQLYFKTDTDDYKPATPPDPVSKASLELDNVPNVDATDPLNLKQSPSFRLVSDAQIRNWTNKSIAPETFLGTYNAATNTPALTTVASATKGGYYTVQGEGSRSNVTGSAVAFKNGDRIISNGTIWSVIQGELANAVVGAPQLLPGAVTPEKTSFAQVGENLYNKLAPHSTEKYQDETGALVPYSLSDVSDFIHVDEGKTYITSAGGTATTPGIVSKQYITYFAPDMITCTGGARYDRNTDYISIPAGTAYVRLTVPKGQKDSFQFQEGSVITAYSDYKLTFTVSTQEGAEALLLAQQTHTTTEAIAKQIIVGDNLYNAKDTTIEEGKYINNIGQFTVDVNNMVTHFIPVVAGEFTRNVNGFVTFFNTSKQVVGSGWQFNAPLTVTIPTGVSFVKCTVRLEYKTSFIFQRGNTLNTSAYFGARAADTFNTYMPLAGKRILGFGTSIPALGGHMEAACAKIGATFINKCIGSSTARIADKNGTYIANSDNNTKVPWENIAYCLAHTIAEKQNLIDNWSTMRTLFSNNPPATLSSTVQSYILNCSYENSLIPYLDGTYPEPHLITFNHMYNGGFLSDTIQEYTSIPANPNDRNYEIGAINFLINEILKRKPKMRIAFIGHYENQRDPRVSQAELTLQAYWGFPLLKLWEKLGLGQRQVPGTAALWNQAPWNGFSPKPGESNATDMSLLRYLLIDSVHLHVDPEKIIVKRATNEIASFLIEINPA